ncbi:MAG: tRNA (adenosine(37)-N6)-dimethylallyltransferase MiaA [Chloroflexota bacterium]|nr:tRNA (adenosine(37)-N6)-dimethylallyltransferase MiaA [Chloroflexota bacterium]
MKNIVAIVGPTAVGKSRLALHLAQLFDGEIVGADSRQVYRIIDIGTAKPTLGERSLVPHHLVDTIDLTESFSLGLYQRLAYETIEDIQMRGKLPVLVGGTGQYVWSALEGWSIPHVPPQPKLRQGLELRAANEGSLALHAELNAIDPVAAKTIDHRNVRRVIRAIEVYKVSGVPFSQLRKKAITPPFPNLIIIGLTTSRYDLYRYIDERVDRMVEIGLIEEVRILMEWGYDFNMSPLTSMGYKQMNEYIRGLMDLPTALERTKVETHRFARHQYAWFRLSDARINWLDAREDPEVAAAKIVRNHISSY